MILEGENNSFIVVNIKNIWFVLNFNKCEIDVMTFKTI